MSQDWICGRFRGVYASERSGNSEGARRLPIQLEYGELSEAQPSAGPPPGETEDELRFAKLPRVRIASDGDERERTLFDVRIRAWRLLYPAESPRRIYGTLVGELSGRLAPVPIEPPPSPVRTPETARHAPLPPLPVPEPPAPAAPSASEPVAPVPLPRAAALPAALPDEATPEQDVERLLWLIVPLVLCVIGGALALACSPHTAGIWLAPLTAAITLRQTPARYRIQSTLARRWFGGLCLLVQGFVLLGPLQTEWTAGCRPPLRAELALLAAPVIAASLLRTQAFLWVCALIWTTALAAWCGGLDGNCTASVLATPGAAVSSLPPAAARTEPDGRWPAKPKVSPAPDAEPVPQAVAPQATEPPRAPSSAPASAPQKPDAKPSAPPQSASPAPPPRSGGGGGDALRYPLISLDQATADPDLFFAPNGPRIYVPTDDIFEPRRAELRSGREANLEQLARLLALQPERRAVIEVHTDASDGAAAQRALARQRSVALSEWFVRRGDFSAEKLTFQPVGATEPLVPSDGSSAEQRANRRLEIRLVD